MVCKRIEALEDGITELRQCLAEQLQFHRPDNSIAAASRISNGPAKNYAIQVFVWDDLWRRDMLPTDSDDPLAQTPHFQKLQQAFGIEPGDGVQIEIHAVSWFIVRGAREIRCLEGIVAIHGMPTSSEDFVSTVVDEAWQPMLIDKDTSCNHWTCHGQGLFPVVTEVRHGELFRDCLCWIASKERTGIEATFTTRGLECNPWEDEVMSLITLQHDFNLSRRLDVSAVVEPLYPPFYQILS